MKRITIGSSGIEASAIVLGCMRMGALSAGEAAAFDQSLRERVIIQTKCGIRRIPHAHYDFSREHILAAVEGSLKRLRTDYIDILLLHRPDALVEPEEVAEAFTRLKESGKVRYFGVSNHNPMQIELLQKYLGMPLVVNQLQLSVCHTPMIDEGLHVNMTDLPPASGGGILEYCRMKEVTVQAWSPLQYGFMGGVFLGSERYPELNAVLDRLAGEKGVTSGAVAIAWILRHPANMQAVVGTTKAERLRELCRAGDVELSRAEWYEIYKAAGNRLP